MPDKAIEGITPYSIMSLPVVIGGNSPSLCLLLVYTQWSLFHTETYADPNYSDPNYDDSGKIVDDNQANPIKRA